jgi:hypothetical protein
LIFSHHKGQVSVRSPQHRLDSRGALFDMIEDPGQTRDIATSQPTVATKLTQAVAAWRRDVFGAKAGGKGTGQSGDIHDDRPFPVGYAEYPWTPLPARDGVQHGGVQRSTTSPNSSYFVNWTNKEDRITWDIDVHTTGTYDVMIEYTCPIPDSGSAIELSFRGATLAGKVTPGWNPPLYTNQDTLPRPLMESQMKEFRPLSLGTMRLERGRGQLTLRAVEIPGRFVMDVRRVNLTLRQ